MALAITVVGLMGLWGGPARAAEAERLRAALSEMRQGDWDSALQVAGARASVTRDIIVWHWLRDGQGTSGDALIFLGRRGDWPGLDWLRRKAEPNFAGADADRILRFFDGNPAQTAEGALTHATALLAQGRRGDAEAELVRAWRVMPMQAALHKTYLENFAELLKPHHEARLDRLLWDGNKQSAGRMLPLVSAAQRQLAETRMALREMAPGVDGMIAKLPKSVLDSPGLAYERFVWRDRKELDDSAIDLMLARSASVAKLGEPAYWGERRRRLARLEMRQGDAGRAYRVAAQHHMTPGMGYAYADLEWLAGFIALTKLNDPATAAGHFERFDAAVESPISKGRAGYWLGRAYAALGDAEKAYEAYAMGADHQTSFYGLLAAERIGRPFDPDLATPPQVPPWREAAFTGSSVYRAARLLMEAGDEALAERFFTHLVESLNAEQGAQMGNMALEMGRPHLAVMIAKRAAQQGNVLAGAYYPLHPVARMDLPMAKEMTLAIARRESEFDPVVVSGAGARGLMQVMPATARLVAEDLGILGGHQTDRLTSDWEYNARLGASYLAGLAALFDGNVVMMSAGYNAGPRRPASWMRRFGDPRGDDVDMVEWIEHIPFKETRNYVMRVTESLPIYRARLGRPALPVPFSEELRGSTLRAFAPERE
ncbi:lytic transglycosylase [Cribrihabitans marinus]|nr:lytic transglycosylase [Cribrihabitans marinus]